MGEEETKKVKRVDSEDEWEEVGKEDIDESEVAQLKE